MRKIGAWLLCLPLLLTGCGKLEQEAKALQETYRAIEMLTMEAEITYHLDGESRSFTVVSTCDKEGATTTVTAPEELAGLSATVTGEELLLRYEGAALPAGRIQEVSAANCVPYLLHAVAEGYLLECGGETIDGMDCLRVAFDTTANEMKIFCTVWFERATSAPCYAEFSTDGVVVLTMRTLSLDTR